MVQCLSKLGAFADGVAYGDEALQVAEVGGRPYECLTVYWRVGYLRVRQGTLHQAIPRLERVVAVSQDANIPSFTASRPRIWRWPTPWRVVRRTPSPSWSRLEGTRSGAASSPVGRPSSLPGM
jgi:hypothetical protein